MSRNPIVSSSLISIENATPSIKRFTFRVDGVPAKQEFKFRPGQWVELSLPSLPSLGKTRFSISCSPDGNATQQQRAFSVTVKDAYQNPIVKYLHDPARRVGDGSLFHAQVGGAFWYREASPDGAGDNANAVQKVLLIAGGVGIAPLMSMLEYVVQGSVGGVLNGAQYPSRKRTHVTLLYSVQDEMELLYVDRLRDLATTFHPGSTGLRLVLDIQLYVTRYAIRKPDSNQEDLVVQSQTNNPLKFYYGCYITPRLLSDYLSSSDADMDSTTIYMCGPESLERSVYSHLQKLEFPIERSLHFERWWK
ncbi:hypothetical protein BC830DRAFT_702903 [Chytriomyces sp. MP71]|nr:hypothetical protein BC830DRAFT_702903 [Chytriomyces sp. MP71]